MKKYENEKAIFEIDDSSTKYSHSLLGDNYTVFIGTSKSDGRKTYLLSDGKGWIYDTQSLEEMGVHIDVLSRLKKENV